MTRLGTLASLGAAIATLAYLAAVTEGWTAVAYATKPLIVVSCLALAPAMPSPMRAWMVTGLLFSLGGDIALMVPGDYFITGLALFLVAHVCYIRALTLDGWRVTPGPALVTGGYLVVMVTWLLPSLGAMRLPVVIYAGVISLMAWQALERAASRRSAAAVLMACGSALFVASDTTLAVNRFVAPVPMERLLIMGTYALAQWGLAFGASRERR